MEDSWLERHGIPNAAVPLLIPVVAGICLLLAAFCPAAVVWIVTLCTRVSGLAWAGMGLIGFVVMFFVIGALMGREGEI